jgi:GH24 family phage-related lysozyme (muramidase)
MSYYPLALELICKHEGFNEKAYADPETGGAPYTFGFGTQFYPDGSPVKSGHCCTKQKALEYLMHEIRAIEKELNELNLHLDEYMRQALISFIHSVGWKPFLYSALIDCIEVEDWAGVVEEFSQWIFDQEHQVIGGLLERRREESMLFLTEVKQAIPKCEDLLLTAFRSYAASAEQVSAIRKLEQKINPYVLAEFANDFSITKDPWVPLNDESLDSLFQFPGDCWHGDRA